jgi:hypothetical protein
VTRTIAVALTAALLALAPAGCGSSAGSGDERPASAGGKAKPSATPEKGGKGDYGY